MGYPRALTRESTDVVRVVGDSGTRSARAACVREAPSPDAGRLPYRRRVRAQLASTGGGFHKLVRGTGAGVIVAASTVAIVAIAAVVIIALIALMYILPRGGRRRRL